MSLSIKINKNRKAVRIGLKMRNIIKLYSCIKKEIRVKMFNCTKQLRRRKKKKLNNKRHFSMIAIHYFG